MKAKSDILQRIKIGTEDELLERIVEHPLYRKEIEPHLASEQDERADAAAFFEAELARHLRLGTELTRVTYEIPFRLVDAAASTLQLRITPRLFKSPDPSRKENATIVAVEDRVLITFQSGFLSLVNRAELLLAVIGHELGHYGFRQLEVRAADAVRGLIDLAEQAHEAPGRRSRADSDLIRAVMSKEFDGLLALASLYSQVCELNCDRAGLLVQPDLSASIEGEMLLASGAADSYGRYEPTSYLAQARELVARPSELFDPGDLEATHPVPALRALAMEFFYSTDVFRELTGRGPATERAADFARVLPYIVPVAAVRPALSSIPRSATVPGFLQGGERAVTPDAPKPAPSAAAPAGPHRGAPPRVVSAEESRPAANEGAPAPAVFHDPDAALSEAERAELTWLLGYRVIASDGKLTRAEETFMISLVRPRALADAVSSKLTQLTDADLEARTTELVLRARALHGRTKTSLIKVMIQAAKADRKIEDDEIAAIYRAGEALDAAPTALRELRDIFGSRADDVVGRIARPA